MSAPEPAHGWLVITAINTVDGGAGSSTFAVTGASRGEPYRDLVRGLIAADVPCPSPGCQVTTLGHLIASLTADQVELIRALDPSQQEGS